MGKIHEKPEGMPGWFDAEKHRLTGAGVMETATGLYLAGDGLPQSGPIRARRLAQAGLATDALEFVSDAAIALQAEGIAEEERLAKVDAAAAKKSAKSGAATEGDA